MFSFLPVGGSVMAAGLIFLVLLGWRLIPQRRGKISADELFETADYVSKLEVTADSKSAGWTLYQLGEACGEPVPVVTVRRGKKRFPAHQFHQALEPGDVLLVEAGTEELKLLADKGELKLGGSEKFGEKLVEAEDLHLVEAVVRIDSRLVNRTVADLHLLDRHNLQLLAVAREGGRLKQRLNKIRLKAGDVLLLQGEESELAEELPALGCLPLASRNLSLGKPRRLILSITLFAAAISVMLIGWLPAPVALGMAAVLAIMTGVLPLREAYAGIDWPIIVLLGALIPVGEAFETSGGAQLVADGLLAMGGSWPPVVTLAILFIITMLLSNVINNAAAALVMAPIAFELASGFCTSADPFLMAVAVSASSAFLTPIGHQSNTLVMGPGGYRFGDYLKGGLPLSILVLVTAIPVILFVWPM